MKTLEELLATIPEGYGWCLRDDKAQGFLANITTPDFENLSAEKGIDYFPVYDQSLHKALEKSIADAKRAMS